MLVGKRILLIISGGIAAYKSLELIRALREEGAKIVPVLTASAKEFVTPLSVAALAGHTPSEVLFDLTSEAEMGHIELSRSADLVVVAPCTADLLARMATGRAEDLASTLLLATDKPVLVAPAMNVRMWEHPATQRNIEQLIADGIGFVGPNEGHMACGEFGYGRLAEPLEILRAIQHHFQSGPLTGKRIIVTSGPTHEPIDPVRYIANRSSGAQGTAIADALVARGAEVVFVTGPAQLPPPKGVDLRKVETAREMQDAVTDALPADAAIFAAAVADWHVTNAKDQKLKKTVLGLPELEFEKNPDILASIAQLDHNRPSLVVGFAAETENVVENAIAKRKRKGCEWIIANDVSSASGIMGGHENAVHVISEHSCDSWPRMSKVQVADKIAELVARQLNGEEIF